MSNDLSNLHSSNHRSPSAVDALVLGTVNAPYKRAISAEELARAFSSCQLQNWIVHVATFFTDVRPTLVIEFAETHGIPHVELENVYATVKRTTGERNPDLEAALVALAHAA
ncbi:hypothetical protein [Rhizobium sp. LjRoot258]|uniref:hypothetical protein n=1 Tax=Rhizobium sp. LjRoot258 TaxID=3342299 RepID=UPI003ECD468E